MFNKNFSIVFEQKNFDFRKCYRLLTEQVFFYSIDIFFSVKARTKASPKAFSWEKKTKKSVRFARACSQFFTSLLELHCTRTCVYVCVYFAKSTRDDR